TTLYTQLHEGSDVGGPVIGAGILRLGQAELADLLKSMRVLNAASSEERLAVLVRFARAFLGNLYDAYGKHLIE
ncbi:MAG: hypothetical protein ACREC6_12765, partial [Hyphomicrobiaceae bacterium]